MTSGWWTPNRIVGGIVLVISLVVFFGTIAPTTSFWDCGEFIACSYTLSVPHPPGAPMYMLMGRLFGMIMPFADIGLRINALSALLSAFAVLLTYLIIVRLTRRWVGQEKTRPTWRRFTAAVPLAHSRWRFPTASGGTRLRRRCTPSAFSLRRWSSGWRYAGWMSTSGATRHATSS